MSDDMDLDLDDDFEEESGSSKENLKEMWDNNPFLKIGLLVIIAIIGGVLYTTYIAGSEKKEGDKSIMRGGSAIRGSVGEEVSEEYRGAIEETNQQRKDFAEQTGVSSLPTPIGRPQGQLEIADKVEPKNLSIDPLQEWRKTAEARRFEMDFVDEELEESPVPEMVPIVEPIRPETQTIVDPELAGRLAEQMGIILASKEPQPSQTQSVTRIDSEYAIWRREQEEIEQSNLEGASFAEAGGAEGGVFADDGDDVTDMGDDSEKEKAAVLIAAGDIVYAQLLNNLNSDIPGPALAHILSGPLSGARAIGSFQKEDKYLVLKFNTLIKDGVSYSVESVALDPDTTLGALVTNIDHHYFQRIILPAASEFISGVGEGITQTDVAVTTDAGGAATSTQSALSTEEIIAKGVQKSFDKVSTIVDRASNREITVTVDKGTPMGLLFTKTLREDEGE